MSNVIASMVRLSTAMTLFGVGQIEKTVNVIEGSADFSKSLEELEKTINSLTEVLTGEMDEKKKETLQSVTKMTEDTVKRSLEGMEIMDPREVLKTTTDLLQKTSDVTANWMSKAASAVEKATATSKSPEEADPVRTQ